MGKSTEVTQDFTAQEVNIMMFSLRYLWFEPNPATGVPSERLFAKTDELVALETFKELKKGLDDEKKSSKDCKLALGTAQKALLLTCMDSIRWGLNDMEHKVSVAEKLV